MEILSKNVGIYSSNSYIVYDSSKKGLVIDCGGDADAIVEIANAHDVTIEAILVTHGHFDHILGVNELKKLTNAPVYGAEVEKDLFFDSEKNLSKSTWSGACTIDCDYYVKDGDILHFKDFDVKVIHLPGHTEGSVAYKIDNIIFSGDTLFRGSIGRTDLYSGDTSKIMSSLKKLIDLSNVGTIIYPGHGPSSTMAEELASNPFLQRLND